MFKCRYLMETKDKTKRLQKVYHDSEPQCVMGRQRGHSTPQCLLSCTTHAHVWPFSPYGFNSALSWYVAIRDKPYRGILKTGVLCTRKFVYKVYGKLQGHKKKPSRMSQPENRRGPHCVGIWNTLWINNCPQCFYSAEVCSINHGRPSTDPCGTVVQNNRVWYRGANTYMLSSIVEILFAPC